MGLKNLLRRWLEVPEVVSPPPSSPVDPDWVAPEPSDAKVQDALAIASVIHGPAPVPPRHAPRSIPKNSEPGIACVVDPNDPNALLGALKK